MFNKVITAKNTKTRMAKVISDCILRLIKKVAVGKWNENNFICLPITRQAIRCFPLCEA